MNDRDPNTKTSQIDERGIWPLDAELEGREVRLISVTYAPGVHTPPHRHPGWQLIYVVRGTVTSQMEGEPPQTYGAGEYWFENREHLHLDAGNDTGQDAEILVFYLTEPGNPILVPEPAAR